MSKAGPSGLFERWRTINDLDLSSDLKHALLAILHYQGDNGDCFASTETLAEDVGVTVNGFNRRIAKLKDRGIDVRGGRRFRLDFDAISTWTNPVGDKNKCASKHNSGDSELCLHAQQLCSQAQQIVPTRTSTLLKGTTNELPMEQPTREAPKTADSITSKKKQIIEEIYRAYPRKAGRAAAMKAIAKAVTKIDTDRLLELVRQYAAAVEGADMKFIPYPATWFNQGRWSDDPDEWKRAGRSNADKGSSRKRDGGIHDPQNGPRTF